MPQHRPKVVPRRPHRLPSAPAAAVDATRVTPPPPTAQAADISVIRRVMGYDRVSAGDKTVNSQMDALFNRAVVRQRENPNHPFYRSGVGPVPGLGPLPSPLAAVVDPATFTAEKGQSAIHAAMRVRRNP